MRVISTLATIALTACAVTAAQSTLEQGIAEFHRGKYSVARQHLQTAVQKAPGDSRARVFLLLTQAALGECQSALPDLVREYTAGTTFRELKRLAGLAAQSCLESQMKAEFPADADVLYQSARSHMRQWNDTLAQMFAKTPSSYRVNQISGEIFETEGRLTEAISEYRKAIAKNPKAVDIHYRLGRAVLLADRTPAGLAEARREFEAELALNAEDAAAEYQIAQILVAEGKREQGTPHYERALALRPGFTEALIALGKIRLEARQYEEAIQLLERAVQQQPRSEPARYNLMMAYRNAGLGEKVRQQKLEIDKLQRPSTGEFTEFLKKLGEKGSPK